MALGQVERVRVLLLADEIDAAATTIAMRLANVSTWMASGTNGGGVSSDLVDRYRETVKELVAKGSTVEAAIETVCREEARQRYASYEGLF